MDLLYRRYADPVSLINQMLLTGNFSDFITEIFEKDNESQLWDFYLHKVDEQSFNDFKDEVIAENTPVDVETTVNDSFDILQGFVPDDI